MPPSSRTILEEARQLLEQERVWDDQLLLTSSSSAVTGGGPIIKEPSRMGPPPVAAEDDGVKNDKATNLQQLHDRYKDCVACPLGTTRIKFVFGVGRADAAVMFIGEGPGYEEDRRGEPFVGKAGQLLDKMLAAIHLDRSQVYIANIVKCHPMVNPETPDVRGNDRPPSTLESETCAPILKQQIAIIQPRIIVTLGSPSTRMILQTTEGITKLRGRLVPFPVDGHYGAKAADTLSLLPEAASDAPAVRLNAEQYAALSKIQVLPTYHPAALLRNPDLKGEAWTDLKTLRDQLAPTF